MQQSGGLLWTLSDNYWLFPEFPDISPVIDIYATLNPRIGAVTRFIYQSVNKLEE